MFKKTLMATVALAMSAGVAQAGDNQYTRQEGIGMFGGAAIGGLVGGPVGAAVGFMVGGILGDSLGAQENAEKRADSAEQELTQSRLAFEQELYRTRQLLERELADTRLALQRASERSDGDEMFAALSQRLHADMLFRTGEAQLSQEMSDKLEELGGLLGQHPVLQVKLHGFADPRGNPEYNLELSMARVSAVRDALIRGGASPEQIQTNAHGSQLATASQGDIEAYAWERRVSLSIQPRLGDAPDTAVARNQ